MVSLGWVALVVCGGGMVGIVVWLAIDALRSLSAYQRRVLVEALGQAALAGLMIAGALWGAWVVFPAEPSHG